MNRNSNNLFLFENPEDWMIQMHIENSTTPILSFIDNPENLPYSIFLKCFRGDFDLPSIMKRAKLEAFDDLILKIPILRLQQINFLFSRTCQKIVDEYPFLYYKWTGKYFKMFAKK